MKKEEALIEEDGDIVYSYSPGQSKFEEENLLLRETIAQLRNEIERYKVPPLMICEIKEFSGENAVIKIPNGNQFYVNVDANCNSLRSGDHVLVEQKNLTVVKKTNITKRFNVEKFVILEKPTIDWKEIGGAELQKEEIREVVELPLKKPELFKKTGVTPPKGILLYGEPGTGKTLMAKAVAASTNATFIEIVGSELVQKFIGEGARLVKEVFELAKEKSPSIIFIDEVDSLCAKRIELGTSGEREVQRTFMQLLAEIDGFDNLGDVKVIACTNRKDILDPAILRPGRLDRHIFMPLPDREGRKEILKIHSKKLNTSKIDFDTIISKLDNHSGADIKEICTEAGYNCIREGREKIHTQDFLKAIEKTIKKKEIEDKGYVNMFG